MTGCRRRLPWVFVPALVLVMGGLLVMHGIDGSHATPEMSMGSPAPVTAVGTADRSAVTDPAAPSGGSVVPVWPSGADHTVGDIDNTPDTGIAVGALAMACMAVLFTVAAAVSTAAVLARVHPRTPWPPSPSATTRRALQTAWRPPAPATHERCVLIC